MKRVKLINDPADLVSLFHSVDSDARREILSLLSQGWTAISVLTEQFGDEANAAISFFEKFKLVESRWEVKDSKPQKAYRTFYNAFQISSSLSFDEAQELLTIVLMTNKKFASVEKKMDKLVSDEGTFANDVSRKLNLTNLQLKGIMKRSSQFDFKGHNIVRVGGES